MAVIQDLPPELLIRILELSIDSLLFSSSQKETRKTFTRTALVTRDWRAPSQSLLSSLFHLDDAHPGCWRRYLEALCTSDGQRFRRMKRLKLDVDRQNRSALAGQLTLLQQKDVDLQELSLVSTTSRGTSRVPNALLGWLVQGIRRLELDTSIQIDENFTLSTKLLLDTLRIGSLVPELPSFLLPFASAAPRLTRLELHCWGERLTPTLNASLCELAPQITDLTIALPLYSSERRDDTASSLESFLRACTSVTAIRFFDPTPSDLKHTLSFLPNCLALLAVSNLSVDTLQDSMPKDLAETFDLPCMAKLRRWRMTSRTNSTHAMGERVEKEWRAACRARGIEPRGAERFFTGESSVGVQNASEPC
ncbi:hypothetical protein BCR35DRAFT_310646 [Leucosporidium creatinivorum]|uniref:F-box domain-containing protein n=1 Tax=Leucosporidium creatinivorum TaxID=106004 RepID=A0A1Y2CYT8_9BASI|nr:hypothetical protein BCR35DRAFT_310646 [Leucosporidium creatinivorum]